MAELGGTFDSGTVDPNPPREPLPTEWYAMRIVSSELKESKSKSQNSYINFGFEIDETYHPELKGRRVWSILNLWNDNATAQEIAQRDLSAMCRAVGVPTITDTEQLHGRPMAVRVVYKPAKGEYGEGNDVKGYAPVAEKFPPAGTVVQPATPPGQPVAPQAGGGGAPAAPAASGAPAAPPWGK